MGLFQKVKEWFEGVRGKPLEEWYRVEVSAEEVILDVNPPGKPQWKDSFAWRDVIRICFKDEGPWVSDAFYVWTKHREESYVVPSEASGADDFVDQVINKELFDSDLFQEAMMSSNGGWYCWPGLFDLTPCDARQRGRPVGSLTAQPDRNRAVLVLCIG